MEDYQKELLDRRIILLTGEIDKALAERVISQLWYLQAKSNKSICLLINSGGGNVSDALAIYDTMQAMRCKTVTICLGRACSMAAILVAAGAPRCRFAYPNTQFLLHPIKGGAYEKHADLQAIAKDVAYASNQIVRILSELTGQSRDVIDHLCSQETYLTALEAMNYGIVDQVERFPVTEYERQQDA